MSTALTVQEFQSALPPAMKTRVNQALVDSINNALIDPEVQETMRENIIGYAAVMQEGRFKITNYVDAVKYISFKLMGATNIMAFTQTFPHKMQNWNANQVASKDIASYVSAYNKSKLVMLIFEQTLIPTHILNADVFQKAINVQAELMTTATSEKVRTDAANSLLNHLKRPETKKIELNLGLKEDDSIKALRETTVALAKQQEEALRAGIMNAKDVAHSNIVSVDGEVVNDC